jgi:tungstate transport system ATP-binding protein
MKPLVEVTALSKHYGKTVALELNRLIIQEGGLYLLTGPNGSGKSTLLNILALLIRPNSGEIRFAGETVQWKSSSLTRMRRQVTLLHQSPYLFRGTVYDNIAFGLALRGIRGARAAEAVAAALAIVRLEGFEHRKSNELSGGEAQRVAMARALALKPSLLLLDEPLANVDRESARVLEQVITALPAKGTTVIMSTHDVDSQKRLPCRVIRLEDGQIALADDLQCLPLQACSATVRS